LNNTKKYIDRLPTLVINYNNSIHSDIKATPKSIHKPNKANTKQVNLVEKRIEKFADKNKELHVLNVGDLVRVSIYTLPEVRKDKLFAKKYVNQFSLEVYKVAKIFNINNPKIKTKYSLIMIKDDKGRSVYLDIKDRYSRNDLLLIHL